VIRRRLRADCGANASVPSSRQDADEARTDRERAWRSATNGAVLVERRASHMNAASQIVSTAWAGVAGGYSRRFQIHHEPPYAEPHVRVLWEDAG